MEFVQVRHSISTELIKTTSSIFFDAITRNRLGESTFANKTTMHKHFKLHY